MKIRRSVRVWGLALAAASCAAAPAVAERPPRGYAARPCGFDLDDDGVVGERQDDCRICDGTTLDPDGDGVLEDLIYVDAQSGDDDSGTGSAGSPLRTVAAALLVADGPGDGAEDIVCLRGVATESSLTPDQSGLAAVRVVPQTGSQSRSFELPLDPAMLVGWDADGDGCYPPYDDGLRDPGTCGTDADVAVLDGDGLARTFVLAVQGDPAQPGVNNGLRYFEMAHLEVRDYGFQTAAEEDIGFVRFGRGAESSHLYLHDLELANINRGKPLESSAIVFDFFVGEMRTSWVWVDNVESLDTGSYFSRGTFGLIDVDGPVRFSRVSYTGFGCSEIQCGPTGSEATVNGFKIWGVADGFEVIDGVWDAQTAAWDPRPHGPVNGVVPDACSRDWVIRNNEFRDWATALVVKGAESACGVRPTDDVLFDANLVLATDGINWDGGVSGVGLNDDGTSTVERSIADVTVVNNFFDAAADVGWRRLFVSEAGNDVAPGPGTVVFAGNSVRGAPTFGGWALVQLLVGTGVGGGPIQFPLPRFRFENNVFTGLAGGNDDDRLIFRADYEPDFELVVDRNAIDPQGTFQWLGGPITDLAGWRAATGHDAVSRSCEPIFDTGSFGDLHLADADSCAQAIGGDLGAWTEVDFDLDARVPGPTLDAGGDEIGDALFADGFESGDTAAWAQTVSGR